MSQFVRDKLLHLYYYLIRKKIYVIGQEMAKAEKEEAKRNKEGKLSISPMPRLTYNNWPYERHLFYPVENSLDIELGHLCKTFEFYDSTRQAKVRHSISIDEIYTLLLYSKRVVVFGIRNKDQTLIRKGLNAVSMIECARCDFRDILITLSLLYFGATRTGGNPEKMFVKTAMFSESGVSDLITGFLKRSEREKDLRQSWGYYEVETNNGIGFINWGYKSYNPTIDLVKIAILISELIFSDKYSYGEVTAGTDIPLTWLSSKDDIDIQKVKESAKGFVSISSDLKKSDNPENNSQTILVFVAQLKSAADATILQIKSLNRISNSYCKTCIVKDDIFCLLITRSCVFGIEPIETIESINRFIKPIEEIIDINIL